MKMADGGRRGDAQGEQQDDTVVDSQSRAAAAAADEDEIEIDVVMDDDPPAASPRFDEAPATRFDAHTAEGSEEPGEVELFGPGEIAARITLGDGASAGFITGLLEEDAEELQGILDEIIAQIPLRAEDGTPIEEIEIRIQTDIETSASLSASPSDGSDGYEN